MAYIVEVRRQDGSVRKLRVEASTHREAYNTTNAKLPGVVVLSTEKEKETAK